VHARMFTATIQPGMAADARSVVSRVCTRVLDEPGCLGVQVFESDEQVVGITTWDGLEHLRAFVDGAISKELFSEILPFLMGAPVTSTYEVVVAERAEGAART
jgi:quinol monooxygenase YgiN